MSFDSIETSSSLSGSILQPIGKKRKRKRKVRAADAGDVMTLKVSENEPYIITLDSIDLKYIHTNIDNNMAGVTPLWNCSRKNYYEFAVVIDNESYEETDFGEVSEIMECEICHICDIEVPVIFLKDHINSEKHKLHQKLIKIVLERAAKSMDEMHGHDTNEKNKNNDIYYCTSCSVVVLKQHKLIHDKTKRHLASHEYDENISSFIKLYINKDSSKENLKKDIEKKNFLKKNKGIELKNDNENQGINLENIENMNLHNDIEKTYLATRDVDNRNDINIEKMIKKKYSDQELTKLIKLKPYNGDKILNVPRYKYHGLQIYENRVYCKLCDCTIDESVDTHVELYKHWLKTGNPINQHGIREVNPNVNHCIACNLLIAPVHTDKHTTEDKVHNKLLNSLINTSNDTEEPQLPKRTYCKTCDRDIDTHNYVAHIKSKIHQSKIDTENSEVQSVKTKLKINTSNDTVEPQPPKRMYCKTCDRDIDTHNYVSHIKSKIHQSKIGTENSAVQNVKTNQSPPNNYISNGTNPKELKCELCKVTIPNTNQNIDEHIKAKRHKENLAKVSNDVMVDKIGIPVNDLIARLKQSHANGSGDNVNNKLNIVSNTNKVGSGEDYCEVCQVNFPRSGKLIHEMGKNHKSIILKVIENFKTQKFNIF